jgi:UDP-2,4-diacetamido-2,4,6-trideoxy-beta-L-altropyranose hydrolase
VETLVMRADANVQIGIGHVMRCLALAQEWRDRGGEVAVISQELPLHLRERFRAERIAVEQSRGVSGNSGDAEHLANRAEQLEARWVVVDGYSFGTDYQQKVKSRGFKLLFVDDSASAGQYAGDLLLNQNVDATELMYRDRVGSARLLLGPRYALLRQEFRRTRPPNRDFTNPAQKLLVTFGGTDPAGLSRKATEAVQLLGNIALEVRFLMGATAPALQCMKQIALPGNAKLIVDPRSMVESMLWADAALTAAGSTCWELCYMGIPALVVIVAENQVRIAQGLEVSGAAENLGHHSRLSAADIAQAIASLLSRPVSRKELSTHARALVDGYGAARVCQAMQ